MTERLSEYPGYAGPLSANLPRRISWPAVFGGTFVALATELLFISFGLFIGLQYTSPGGISVWAEAWYFVSAFCSLFIGGWATAKFSTTTSGGGRLHAAVTWGLTTIATFTFALWILWGLLGTSLAAIRTADAATNHAAATSPSPVTQNEATHIQNQTANAVSVANQQAPELASIIAGEASSLFLILFGGILCGCVGALVGGSVGRVGEPTVDSGTPATVRNTNTSAHAASA